MSSGSSQDSYPAASALASTRRRAQPCTRRCCSNIRWQSCAGYEAAAARRRQLLGRGKVVKTSQVLSPSAGDSSPVIRPEVVFDSSVSRVQNSSRSVMG